MFTKTTTDITIEQIIEAVKNEDLDFLVTALKQFENKGNIQNGRKATSYRSA